MDAEFWSEDEELEVFYNTDGIENLPPKSHIVKDENSTSNSINNCIKPTDNPAPISTESNGFVDVFQLASNVSYNNDTTSSSTSISTTTIASEGNDMNAFGITYKPYKKPVVSFDSMFGKSSRLDSTSNPTIGGDGVGNNNNNNNNNDDIDDDDDDDDEFDFDEEPFQVKEYTSTTSTSSIIATNTSHEQPDIIKAAAERASQRIEKKLQDDMFSMRSESEVVEGDKKDVTEEETEAILSNVSAFDILPPPPPSSTSILSTSSNSKSSSNSNSNSNGNNDCDGNNYSIGKESLTSLQEIRDVYGAGLGDQEALIGISGSDKILPPAPPIAPVSKEITAIIEEEEEEEDSEEDVDVDEGDGNDNEREIVDNTATTTTTTTTTTTNLSSSIKESESIKALLSWDVATKRAAQNALEEDDEESVFASKVKAGLIDVSVSGCYTSLMTYLTNMQYSEDIRQNLNTSTPRARMKGIKGRLGISSLPPSLTSEPSKVALELPFLFATVSYDPSDQIHWTAMDCCFKELCHRSAPSRSGSHWEEIGFQSIDPRTDINRSMKMLAVLQMLNLLKTQPQLAQRLWLMSRRGSSSSSEGDMSWPFYCVSIGFTKDALQLLRDGWLNSMVDSLGSALKVLEEVHIAMFYALGQLLTTNTLNIDHYAANQTTSTTTTASHTSKTALQSIGDYLNQVKSLCERPKLLLEILHNAPRDASGRLQLPLSGNESTDQTSAEEDENDQEMQFIGFDKMEI